jgi:deaminated glutathione amidase
MGLLRVGAAQFGVGESLEENLAAVLKAMDVAASEGVQLLVLPEFSNHMAWYDNPDHAWDVAVSLDDEWLSAVADQAWLHDLYVQVNVSLRTSQIPGSALTASNLLFSPEGSLVGRSDKTVLMGNENTFFTPASTPNPVLDLPIGRVGLYACMEGMVNEPPRHLAVRGAQLLLNSLNSFASDEASQHIPVRAAENGVFVVAACKIGPLVPIARLEMVASALKISVEQLRGAGESQIVGPDGTVLVRAGRDEETVVVADIDLDDTAAFAHRWLQRRPAIYGSITADPSTDALPSPDAFDSVVVACVRTEIPSFDALIAGVQVALAQGAELLVLPPFGGLRAETETAGASLAFVLAGCLSTTVESQGAHIVTTIREGNAHVGVVIGAGGIIARQLQIHNTGRFDWLSDLGAGVMTIDLPWGRLGVVVGDDLAICETARLVALAGAHVVAAPASFTAAWETSYGLIERSAENRVNLVAAAAFDDPIARAELVGGAIASLPTGMTLWAERAERPFDGTINMPTMQFVDPDAVVTIGTVRPRNATNKQLSKGTDLVQGRRSAYCHVLSPRSGLSVGKDALAGLEAKRRCGPPAKSGVH